MAKPSAHGTNEYAHDGTAHEANISLKESLSVSDAELIASPVILPCGLVIPNRLIKVAMYEHLASFAGGPPNQHHFSLYSRWARGGWGMIVTGNCQISSSHLTLGRDITCPTSDFSPHLDAFKALSAAMHSSKVENVDGTLAILQLSHSGRQSPRFIGGRMGTFRQPLGPSTRRVGDDTREGWIAKFAYRIMFQTPRVISEEELEEVIDGFVRAAKTASETGFDGVQLHASHGYILSQFLSPKLNTRSDEYSEPLLLVKRIITRIRVVAPSRFALGIKLNAGDYVTGGLSKEDALEHVRQIALLGVDFIEISGGDYENPDFMAAASPRQVFFSSFSRLVVQALPTSADKPTPLIILTGALRTPSQFSRILRQKHAHLLGLGRVSILCPDLPHRISSLSKSYVSKGTIPQETLTFPLPEPILFTPRWFPRLLGAGVGTAWYIVGMRRLARGRDVDIHMGSLGALFWMWFWAGPRDFAGIFIWTLVLAFMGLAVLTSR